MKSDLELFGSLYSGEGQIEIWLVLIHESPLLGSDACYISSVRWIKKKDSSQNCTRKYIDWFV
jgi:hypothetical protein